MSKQAIEGPLLHGKNYIEYHNILKNIKEHGISFVQSEINDLWKQIQLRTDALANHDRPGTRI